MTELLIVDKRQVIGRLKNLMFTERFFPLFLRYLFISIIHMTRKKCMTSKHLYIGILNVTLMDIQQQRYKGTNELIKVH
jgi:hypothetical protein